MKDVLNAVAFVAATSGSGKTTLIEGLVKRLRGKGYRVGTVKHSIHDVTFDRKGSDSWRFEKAGAEVTVLASRGRLDVFRAVENPSADEALQAASPGTDIVLVEGYRESPLPKIEVFRPEVHQEPLCREDDNLIALASDVALDLGVPRFSLNDTSGLAEFLSVYVRPNIVRDST